MYCSNNLDTIAAQVSCTMTQTVHLATQNKWPMVLYSPHVARHQTVIASKCSTQMALRSTVLERLISAFNC